MEGETVLILQRHGIAQEFEDRGEWVIKLTQEGRRIHEAVAQQIASHGYLPNCIFCSPLLRAKESAEITAKTLNSPVIVDERLENCRDAEGLLELIAHNRGNEIAFVGHEPTLIALGRRLVGSDIFPHGLRKSECAIIAFRETPIWGGGRLVDSIPPLG